MNTEEILNNINAFGKAGLSAQETSDTYTRFFNALAGVNKPAGTSMQTIVEHENLMNGWVPIKNKGI
jgi:hypothetical protein